MNEDIDPGKLLEDVVSKAPELDAFLDSEISHELAEASLVVLLSKKCGPYQDR